MQTIVNATATYGGTLPEGRETRSGEPAVFALAKFQVGMQRAGKTGFGQQNVNVPDYPMALRTLAAALVARADALESGAASAPAPAQPAPAPAPAPAQPANGAADITALFGKGS